MKVRFGGWLLMACFAILAIPQRAGAMEYRFDVGQQWIFNVRDVEPPSEIECQIIVTCEKAVVTNIHRKSVDTGGLLKPEYTLRIGVTNLSIRFQYEQRASDPYERALAHLTNFSYVVVLDGSGRLLSSNFADSVGKLDCGSTNSTTLVLSDVIRPLTAAVWRYLFPRFLRINDDRVFFGTQDCAKLEMPEFAQLSACREGYRIRRDARMSDGAKGCAIWEDIVEAQSTSQLGDDEDVEVRSRTVLLYDNARGVFSRVYIARTTDFKSRERSRASHKEAYFIGELGELRRR